MHYFGDYKLTPALAAFPNFHYSLWYTQTEDENLNKNAEIWTHKIGATLISSHKSEFF